MKKRRTFTREFKLEAVKKVVLQGMSPGEVARDLGSSRQPTAQLEKEVSKRWDAGRTDRRERLGRVG